MNSKFFPAIAAACALLAAVVSVASFVGKSGQETDNDNDISASVSDVSENLPANPDDYGAFEGTVLDKADNDKAIENVTITAVSVDSAEQFSAKTDENGEFSLSLPAGEYYIRTSCNGYNEEQLGRKTAIAGKTASLFSVRLTPDVDFMSVYVSYITDTLVKKYGYAGMNQFRQLNSAQYGGKSDIPSQIFGLVSTDIYDVNGDGVPELTALEFLKDNDNYIWQIEYFVYRDGEVTPAGSYSFKVGRDGQNFGVDPDMCTLECASGYLILTVNYIMYEGSSTSCIVLKPNKNSLDHIYNIYSKVYGDDVALNVNGTKINLGVEYIYDFNKYVAAQRNKSASYIGGLFKDINLSYSSIGFSAYSCLKCAFADSHLITDYNYDTDTAVFTPSDKSGLRERLVGFKYSTNLIEITEPEETTEASDPAWITDITGISMKKNETVTFDIDGNGYEETIDCYIDPVSKEVHGYRIIRAGNKEEYAALPGINSFDPLCIVRDNNLGMTYIAYLTAEHPLYTMVGIRGCTQNVNVEATEMYSYDTEKMERDYKVNGVSMSKSDVLNYMKNIEILHSITDKPQQYLDEIIDTISKM